LKFEGGLVNFTPLKNTLAVKGLKKVWCRLFLKLLWVWKLEFVNTK